MIKLVEIISSMFGRNKDLESLDRSIKQKVFTFVVHLYTGKLVNVRANEFIETDRGYMFVFNGYGMAYFDRSVVDYIIAKEYND